MAGDRRVHHTERSRWRHTFRRLAAGALAALTASDPVPAQQAVAKIVDLACDMKRYDYFHSDDPVEAGSSWYRRSGPRPALAGPELIFLCARIAERLQPLPCNQHNGPG
jgi:hypothetical protein